MIIHVARRTLRICMTAAGVLLILLALFTATARLGLPLLANYKSTIETRVGDFLKSPVDIGELTVNWEGTGPMLRAREVAVLESGQRSISLDELLIDLNLPLSLWRGVAVIDELTLVGAHLSIETDSDGRWRLRGVNSSSGSDNVETARVQGNRRRDGSVMDWLLTTGKVGLLDSTVNIRDLGTGRTLDVGNLDIRAENDGPMHQIRLEMELPGQGNGRLEAGIDLLGRAGALSESDGDLYLRSEGLQIATLEELLSLAGTAPVARKVLSELDTRIDIELWGRWESGQLVSVHGPLSTTAIVDTTRQETVLNGVSSVLDIFQSDDSLVLETRELLLDSGQEKTRIDDLALLLGLGEEGEQPRWTFEAQGQDLPLSLLQGLPASVVRGIRPDLSTTLLQADPTGWLRDWHVSLKQDDTNTQVLAHASLDQLQWQASGAVPGAGPLSGRLDMDGQQGRVTLAADDMAMDWPAYTGMPLHLDSLRAEIVLDASDPLQWHVDTELALGENGIDTSGRVNMVLESGQSPHLDAQLQYEVSDLNAIKAWLPRRKMGSGLQKWFDRAFEGGQARDGQLIFFGHLADFPFREGEGVFDSSVEIRNGQLAFLPTWPTARDINGTLSLDGLSLEGHATGGALDSFDVSQTRVRIDDLSAAVLELQGTAAGKLPEVVDFLNTGPLSQFLEPVFNDVTGNGDTTLDLQLQVPLSRKALAKQKGDAGEQIASQADLQSGQSSILSALSVDGSVFLSGNELHFGRADMTLEQVSGAVGFDQNGIRINNLRARALDQAVVINGATEGVGRAATTRVEIDGALKGSDALAHYGSQLDQFLRGASSWNIRITAPHSAERVANEGVGLRLSSDLVGTELLLPAPFRKGTAASADIVLQTAFREGQQGQRWLVDYDQRLAVGAEVDEQGLESLQIHVGSEQPAESLSPTPEPGIHLTGKADIVAIDGWVDTIAQFIDSLPDGEGEPQPMLPIEADLSIESVQVGQRLLGPGSVNLDSDDTYLNANLESRSLSGSARYPREYWTRQIAMEVNLERLDSTLITALLSRDESAANSADSEALDPRLLPPIEATVSRLTHKDYTLRDLVLRAEPDVSGLSITTLGFAHENATLVGDGYWRLRDPQNVNPELAGEQMSRLNLVLQSSDFGRALEAVGLDNVLSDGEGSVETHLSWPGALYAPEIARIDGSIQMLIERGNIIPLEPQAGRVVGLFALQALPRRLEFDFKDVTADGLAFRSISGDISIDDGIANAELVQLTGPIGVVDITGRSDIVRREFDQHITVLPRVSAALPLIGVITGGATAGIGALVATGFLKAIGIDLDRIGLRDYSLTGKWEDPVFEAVDADYRHRQ